MGLSQGFVGSLRAIYADSHFSLFPVRAPFKDSDLGLGPKLLAAGFKR